MDKNKTLIRYKLIDQDGYTRRNESGETYWLDGQWKAACGSGNKLCSDDVIHYYSHPLLAVLFNPIHVKIVNPRLITIEIDKIIAFDALKGGCKKARYIKEIELPRISTNQKVSFSITIALKYYKDKEYKKWAINWINGKDRSGAAGAAAAEAAGAAAWAAGAAGAAAAEAAWAEAGAAGAAWAATGAAEAAWAAAGAAGAAAWAAGAAEAGAAEAAAWAAAGAAGAAEAAAGAAGAAEAAAGAAEAAWAVKSNRFFIKTIRKIIKNGQE